VLQQKKVEKLVFGSAEPVGDRLVLQTRVARELHDRLLAAMGGVPVSEALRTAVETFVAIADALEGRESEIQAAAKDLDIKLPDDRIEFVAKLIGIGLAQYAK